MMKSLKISEIRMDAGTQIRVRIDDATVKEYAEAYRDGAKFPPVVVFHDGSENILADGFHRVWGAKAAGLVDVLADVRRGSRVDALKYALGANAVHGLKRTNADKRRAVELALKEFSNLSDRAIAEMCCVSHNFVGDVRRQLSSDDSCPSKNPNKTPLPPPPQVRVGRDGKERKLPPPPQVNAKRIPPPPVVAPVPEVRRCHTGCEIPAAILPLWERAEEVQGLLSSLSTLRGILRKAEEEKDKVFAEVNFSSIKAHLDQAYADLKTAKPFAVCPACEGKTPDNCALCKGRGFISEHRWNSVVSEEQKAIRKKLTGVI